ncbi:MAG: hypothetical protein KatS3mg076_0047 [Candidatus Binatia bacterium]|nr:MAG: hypothetical protein KatS3mg076_0047 [Candidatus Binatia bacterium]
MSRGRVRFRRDWRALGRVFTTGRGLGCFGLSVALHAGVLLSLAGSTLEVPRTEGLVRIVVLPGGGGKGGAGNAGGGPESARTSKGAKDGENPLRSEPARVTGERDGKFRKPVAERKEGAEPFEVAGARTTRSEAAADAAQGLRRGRGARVGDVLVGERTSSSRVAPRPALRFAREKGFRAEAGTDSHAAGGQDESGSSVALAARFAGSASATEGGGKPPHDAPLGGREASGVARAGRDEGGVLAGMTSGPGSGSGGTGGGSGGGHGTGHGSGIGPGRGVGRAECAYCPEPRYPALARRRGWQGEVALRLLLSPDGRVQRADVRHSSGYEVLDREALEAARRSRFRLREARGRSLRADIEYEFRLRR